VKMDEKERKEEVAKKVLEAERAKKKIVKEAEQSMEKIKKVVVKASKKVEGTAAKPKAVDTALSACDEVPQFIL
jgi:F0F1-type ATP synthase membrane subunit b/b'